MTNIDQYNPYPSFQPGQAEAIHQILEAFENGEKVVELNAPTAAGKSLDLYVVGRILSEMVQGRVIYTTPLVALVNQLEDTKAFSAMPVLKGKANYKCPVLQEALGDSKACADDCPYDTWDDAREANQVCASCQYQMARTKFMASNFGATTLARYQMPGPIRQETTILLIDESAGLEKTLIDRATLLMPEEVDLRNLIPSLTAYYHKLTKIVDELSKQIQLTKDLKTKVKLNQERSKADREAHKCTKVLAHLDAGHPYIIDKDRKFRLLDGRSEFEAMIEGLEFVVLASGTPTTGILTDKYQEVRIQHPIPVENRLCIYEPIGSMSYQERNKTAPKIASRIAELHNAHHKKTMVHCGSYVVASMIYDSMPASVKAITILQEQKDREGSKNKFLKASEAIFLSVNFEEGLDLKGPDYPTNVIAKMTFENIKDEFVMARNERDRYKRYNMNTAVSVMQAAGRCTRTVTDYSRTYILDSSWQGFYARCNKLFQPWFKAALRNGNEPEIHQAEYVQVNSQPEQKPANTYKNTSKPVGTPIRTPVEQAILYLAGQCDGAVTKDGVGFNGRDTDFGHSLADWLTSGKYWSAKQAAAATKIAKTYTKQLAKAGINI